MVGARALQSGLAARVANMVFDMYKRHRYVKVHGAVAGPRPGGHGLVAGCAFAKDIPKTFKPQDYVDDITQEVSAPTAAL